MFLLFILLVEAVVPMIRSGLGQNSLRGAFLFLVFLTAFSVNKSQYEGWVLSSFTESGIE